MFLSCLRFTLQLLPLLQKKKICEGRGGSAVNSYVIVGEARIYPGVAAEEPSQYRRQVEEEESTWRERKDRNEEGKDGTEGERQGRG